MPTYKKVIIMILASLLGIIIGYTNAESTLTRIFQYKKDYPK